MSHSPILPRSSQGAEPQPRSASPRPQAGDGAAPDPLATTCDVAVIGGGIAGMAACVFLREAGYRVVCLEAREYPHQKVGESLDWSSPGLLGRLGLLVQDLIAADVATFKKNIVVCQPGRPDWDVQPPAGLRRSPLRFETVTLQVDREAVDQKVYERALSLGTEFIRARVTQVETAGDRVLACVTDGGMRVTARWYIDATGTQRRFAQAMGIPKTEYGRQKVALWTYFDTPLANEGTTFFVDNADPYLSWIWEIPISSTRISVGYVLLAEAMEAARRAGSGVSELMRAALDRFPRFRELLAAQPELQVQRVAFRPYVSERACGPNWLLAGEAASMPDPLTGNGFTSAIRHARYATEAIVAAGAAEELPAGRRRCYEQHVQRLGRSFNAHIEDAVYRHPLRWCFGAPTATVIYTLFGFFINALYARFDPRGPLGMLCFKLIFAAARLWIGAWSLLAHVLLRLRRPALRPATALGVAAPGGAPEGLR